MADFTINADSNPQHYGAGSGTPFVRYYQESTCASTAVIKRGDIVSFDTVVSSASFRIVRATAGGGAATNLLNTTNVVGIALEASTSDGSTSGLSNPRNRQIAVAIAEPNAEFLFSLINPASAADISQIGLLKAIRYDSTNHIWGVDSTNSTAADADCAITAIPEPNIGDTNGYVVVKFLSTNVSPAVRAL